MLYPPRHSGFDRHTSPSSTCSPTNKRVISSRRGSVALAHSGILLLRRFRIYSNHISPTLQRTKNNSPPKRACTKQLSLTWLSVLGNLLRRSILYKHGCYARTPDVVVVAVMVVLLQMEGKQTTAAVGRAEEASHCLDRVKTEDRYKKKELKKNKERETKENDNWWNDDV